MHTHRIGERKVIFQILQHFFLEKDPEAEDFPRAKEEGVGEHLVPEPSLDLRLQGNNTRKVVI